MNHQEFLAAVGQGDASAVAEMLAADPHLAAPRPGEAADPVALAACHGHLAVLRLLLDRGAMGAAEGDPREAPTALMAAAGAGQQEAVALLLEHGADPALRDPVGRTAADHATEAGHADLARRLATDAEAERIVR
ncbi:ankyrin repeat domain-containing protein [Paeniroseomonas aquatica]|uniref:Ankyrin repeat domain-containing protein n=1 Tax=Paeniroseomonas aquatica TaxID=373043 RepID=A0ABT8A7V3_9PROT|nr:ankyrin repeat domain-containing protein [Paeniroseomonas aquatica]MDN3565745.1 ankyrin repeat domain-containing protein [Paeniroseomonas aquatica]